MTVPLKYKKAQENGEWWGELERVEGDKIWIQDDFIPFFLIFKFF